MADITITAADVNMVSGRKISGTAGATITAGQSVYRDGTDSNKLKPADADTQATAVAAGIALHSASAGQPLQYQESGTLDTGATLSVGTVYVVSTTAGGIAPWADLLTGDYVSLLGVAVTANNLELILNNSGVTLP